MKKKGFSMSDSLKEYEVTVEFGDKDLLNCINNILDSLAQKNGYFVVKEDRTG